MIDLTPNPVAFHIGSFPVLWYGICYAVGLAAVYVVLTREARRRGQNAELVGNGMVIVAIAALLGGRLYHVIDQWALYQGDPITAILPITRNQGAQPSSTAVGALFGGVLGIIVAALVMSRFRRIGQAGIVASGVLLGVAALQALLAGSYSFAGFSGLGVPGGIITGTIAAWYLTRRWKVDFATWADIVAPGLFVMQAIGRIGNFFNQELYGPPTTLPWGIAIDCAHRVAAYPCETFPVATTHFHPLFLYESLSGVIGAAVLLWLARRPRSRLLPGDLLLIFFVWYGTTRFVLEFLRSGNWTFFGIPMAQIVSAAFIVVGLALLWYRHRGRGSRASADSVDIDGAAAGADAKPDPPAAEPDSPPA